MEELVALRVNDAQNLAAAHTEKNKPLLALFSAVVNPLNAERIAKSISCLLKSHAMLTIIRGGLGVIPCKVYHIRLRVTSSFVK